MQERESGEERRETFGFGAGKAEVKGKKTRARRRYDAVGYSGVEREGTYGSRAQTEPWWPVRPPPP